MERITAIVDTQTNQFIVDGHAEDARFRRVDLPRNPDALTERYSGDPLNPFRSATAQERADVVTAAADAQAARDVDQNKVFQAFAMVTYQYLNPATKPATVVLYAKEIKAKYKTLL